MPGYSGKSVADKLGITAQDTVATINAPPDYKKLLEDPPRGAEFTTSLRKKVRIAHLFATKRAELDKQLPRLMKTIHQDGMIWVSWPKKTAKVPTDITEQTIRDVALPMGLVDVKVCAVSEVWSGLKLVIRKSERV